MSIPRIRFLKFFAIFCATFSGSLCAAIPDSERAVLDAIYQQTNGPGWTRKTNWEGPRGTECTWYGIGCDSAQTHVMSIDIGSNNLVGTLPSLTNLPLLVSFFASYDPELKGNIPAISGLTQLKQFVVDFDQLSGNIPSLSNLPSLETLDLGFNQLTGSIPDLSGVPNLVILGLEDNQLTGSIPDLSGLTNLKQLAVGNNDLSGNIPSLPPYSLVPGHSTLCNNGLNHIANTQWDIATGESPWYHHCTLGQPGVVAIPLSERAVLDALFGQTVGVLWTAGFSYTNHVGWGGEYGTECVWLGITCTPAGDHIAGISLPSNNLVGTLPALTNLPFLQSINFSNNTLTGSIPVLMGLPVEVVNLSNNQLVNSLPNIAGIATLREFRVRRNQLTGSIPPLSGLSSTQLLDFSENQLSGNIPDLGQIPSLQSLQIGNNQLTGSIPSLSALGQLQYAEFSHNQLTGGVPAMAAAVQHFGAAYNRLTGSLPALLAAGLTEFDIGFNGITGDPPSAPSTLTQGKSRLCNNPLNHVASSAWDLATGNTPWYANCASAASTLAISTADTTAATGTNTSIAAFVSLSGKALVADASSAFGTTTVVDDLGNLICFVNLDTTGKGSCNAVFPSGSKTNLTASYSGNLSLGAASTAFSKTAPVVVPGNLDQHGWTGAWYNPATTGQGIIFEVYPDVGGLGIGLLGGGWFTYDSTSGGEDHKRWYTLSGPVSSTSASASLEIISTTGGNFNAGPIITSGNGKQVVGAATLNFTDCQHGELTYSFTTPASRGANVADTVGRIPLVRLDTNVTCDATNGAGNGTPPGSYLLSGAWYAPSTSGQGILFDINPIQNVTVAAWYTFAPNGQAVGGGASQRWYTLQTNSAASGGNALNNIAIYSAQGGTFNAPGGVVTPQVGSATIKVIDCNHLVLTYSFGSGTNSGLSGSVNLQRVGPTPLGCSS